KAAAKYMFAASAHAAVGQTGALYAEQGAYHCLGAPRIGKEAPMRRALKLASVLVVLSTSALAEMNGVLRIGLLNDMASVYADLGGAGSVLAAQMAVEDFAKQSKRKVRILSADHQNKPDLGAGIARRWFDVEDCCRIQPGAFQTGGWRPCTSDKVSPLAY